MKNIWPILVILYVKSRFVIIARGVQLDNGVDPPCIQNIIITRRIILHYQNWEQLQPKTLTWIPHELQGEAT